jgi:type IV pilus assembly protein PilW
LPEKTSTRSRRSSHACTEGYSLIEILVSLAVTGVIAAATLTIALSTRGMFETDQHRTTINQNLRAGIDLLGIDVRQAGERLPFDAPAVEITDGSSGAPDELTLRRNMLDYVLPVCKVITAGSNADTIFVGTKKVTGNPKVPQGCIPVPDENGDGWPDNLEAWRNYRIANGGEILAFIHNPVTGNGEFFVYDDEDNATFHMHKQNSENWIYGYAPNQEPRVYILEQRTFRLQGDVLQVIVNNDTSGALNLVNRIRDLQVQAVFKDGSVQSTLAGRVWTDLESIDITLVAGESFDGRDMNRTVETRFFPRNILSH